MERIALVAIGIHMAVVLVAAVVISANRRPSSAIAWVLAIIFIPVLGTLLFLLVGTGRLPRARRDKQREVNELVAARTQGLDLVSHREEWPGWMPSLVRMNVALGALPMVGGNRIRLLEDYAGSFAAMVADIDAATEYVHVEFYILVKDAATEEFFAALARARSRGVEVRVLSDHLSSFLLPNRTATVAALRDTGVEWFAMLPLRPFRRQWQRPDLRNHRKLVVVDGRVGYTGSQNLVDATYHKRAKRHGQLHWVELMVRVEGPVVRELNAIFVADWYSESNEILPFDTTPVVLRDAAVALDAQAVPSGPSFENDNNLKLYVGMIHGARERISITSPYFVPDESTMLAIVTACARGVAVELFVSAAADQALVYHAQRSYYEQLLRACARIYLYRAPEMLHSKHFSIDDDAAVIGSSNMDIRSFSLNMEVSLLVHGRAFVDDLRRVEDAYRAKSDPLTLREWTARPLSHRVNDSLARLTSSLQ